MSDTDEAPTDESNSSGDSEGAEPDTDAPPADEPIETTTVEKGAAILILSLMGLSLAYLVWTVIRFWNRVGV